MRYAYHAFLVVAEADLEQAQALAQSELGPVDGAGWFSVRLTGADEATHYGSASALTEANVGTVGHYQAGGTPLTSLRYFVIDAATRLLVASNVGEASAMLGSLFSFGEALNLLGLTIEDPTSSE